MKQYHHDNQQHILQPAANTQTDDRFKSVYAFATDQEVWSAFRKGHEMAFNHLYRKYVPSLFNFGCQFTKDHACVQDCIQNLFIDLRRRRERLGDVQSVKSYLYKSLYHELLRRLEKDKKLMWQEEGVDEQHFGVELSIEEKMIGHELSEEVRLQLELLLNGLTVRQKKAMLLFYAEGFSYAEVAEAMDLKNPKQARKLIYRALEMAKKGAGALKSMGKLLATALVICVF